ncbi:MAG: hypothetical protein IKQ61_01270 [Spirochaetales bacterium]|nr:hypothetical protein [Spirochaetales bacterium]
MNCCGDVLSTVLTAIGTVTSVVIAFFALYESCLKKVFFHPKLKLTWDTVFPYRNRTIILIGDKQTDVSSFKIRIENKGRAAAKNVQVYLHWIKKMSSTGDFEYCKNVLPMNLIWSFQDNAKHPSTTAPVIAKKAEKYCDFLFFNNNMQGFLRTEAMFAVIDDENNTIMNNALCNNLSKEVYQCELIVLASNAKPLIKRLEFECYNPNGNNPNDIVKKL